MMEEQTFQELTIRMIEAILRRDNPPDDRSVIILEGMMLARDIRKAFRVGGEYGLHPVTKTQIRCLYCCHSEASSNGDTSMVYCNMLSKDVEKICRCSEFKEDDKKHTTEPETRTHLTDWCKGCADRLYRTGCSKCVNRVLQPTGYRPKEQTDEN
jgi:hypothetical protein